MNATVTTLNQFVGNKGYIFTVDFIASDGTKRTINGRLGVTKNRVADIYLDREVETTNRLSMYDMKNRCWTIINVSNIKAARLMKTSITFNAKQNKQLQLF